jgi:RNA polymerase sigma factor (sigma-70 family)
LLTTTPVSTRPCLTARPTALPGRSREAVECDGPTLLASHLDCVNEAIRYVCRCRNLSKDAAEELSTAVYLKLLRDNGATLRQFRGESSLRTFLVIVVRRVLLDTWIAKRGKWRPSSHARQLGKIAVELERLVFREEMSLSEAAQTIRHALGVSDTDDELAFLLSLLPARPLRRFISDSAVTHLPSLDPDPLQQLLQRTSVSRETALKRALATLTAEERLLLTLRFERNLTVREVAEMRRTDQKGLYRRYERILRQLRASLEGRPPIGPARARTARSRLPRVPHPATASIAARDGYLPNSAA